MARIAGINIPLNKRVEIGLTYIYGVGDSQSRAALAATGVDQNTYVRDLTEDEVRKLRDYIDTNLTVEGDLRRDRSQNVKRLMEIGCYRGLAPPHAPGGDGLLPRPAPPARRASQRPADEDERAHAQGPEADAGGRQEEGE